jgi:hypothetical protein
MSGLSGDPLAVELAERGDIPGAVAAQMESARRNGSHPDGVKRSGKLFLTMVHRVLKGKVARLEWEAGLLKLEAHGSAGKAVATGLRMELLEEQMAQLRLDPRMRREGVHGGKAMNTRNTRSPREGRDLARFIRRIGGYVPDGRRPDDALDYDDAHFERAVQLIRAEVEPDSDDERRELERWRAKYPPPGAP